jgi:hypothetical protein
LLRANGLNSASVILGIFSSHAGQAGSKFPGTANNVVCSINGLYMIKSKFGFQGGFSLIFETAIFLVLTALAADTLSSYFFSYDIIRKTDVGIHRGFLVLLVLICFILWFFRVLLVLRFITVVSVDNFNDTFSFKNILTRKVKVILKKDLDGYFDVIKRSSGGSTKEILLMKNRKVVGIFSDEYYSNYNELAGCMSDANYLGRLDYNFQDKLRMFLNKEI